MGEIIEFPSNGSTGQGYIALPAGGAAETVGIIVIQEWWGLVDQIKHTCDRFAAAGFTALAPDLYHGTTVPLTEPDEAGKQMMALKMDTAAKDLSGAVDELVRRTGGARVGVIGFCMGGGLALVLATQRPDAVKAVVAAYGLIPWPDAQPDYSQLDAAVLLEVAGQDDFFTPEAARELQAELDGLGKATELHVYPDAGHAFFNEDRPEAHHGESAELLWDRTVSFFRRTLAAGAH
jgi:carboxymethylenebutenolidase